MDLKDIELEMLRKGYVSARMLAEKTHRHVATIITMMRQGKLETVSAGSQRFALISSAKAAFGADAVKLFSLDDWSAYGPHPAPARRAR